MDRSQFVVLRRSFAAVHLCRNPSTLGVWHSVCFRVDDLRAVYDRLREKGVRFVTEPKFRDVDGRSVGVVYAQDPEGNWLEFIEGL